MMHDQFRTCLEQVDIRGARKIWKHVYPGMPQPKTDWEALITLHYARTLMDTITFKLRAYSHSWLRDQGFPSGLPDHLLPKADRLYPRVAEGVAIGGSVRNPLMLPVIQQVRKSMEDAVLDIYAHKPSPDPVLVKARMMEAREYTFKKLIG